MSLGPSLTSANTNNNLTSNLIQSSLIINTENKRKRTNTQELRNSNRPTIISKSVSTPSSASSIMNSNRYSYKTCPICSQRLLVRINGSFVYKWVSTHFSTHHHEWMHVVVNLHES